MAEQCEPPNKEPADWFTTTNWSVVRSAGERNTPAAQDALQQLCVAYWDPLYGYVRRKGHDEHDAADLTQEFFARLLARNDFAALQQQQGRFRAFLLAAMNHFLAKEWRKASSLKRGGGKVPISLDLVLAEQNYNAPTASEPTPQRLFDRRWAETVLQRAAKQLGEEYASNGRNSLFRELNVFLSMPAGTGDYSVVAVRLQMTTSAIAKAVERLRRRYRDLVQTEISQTVSTPAELDDEMRYLLEVLT